MLPPEFQAVFDVLPDGVISADASDRILYVNPAVERLLGWERDALIGQPLTVIMPERLRAKHEAGFHHYFRTHTPRILGRPIRVPGLRKDGTELDIELTLASVISDDGEQIVAVLRDLRERVELERQIDITRAQDEFIAMLGHELRNPLAAILTAVELMELRGGEPAVREREIIKRQGEYLVTLVDDVLDVARVTQGKIALHKSTFEIAIVIERAIELARPALEKRRHQLVVAVPQHGMVVDADGTRLTQVFANLLTNAAKYTPPGGQIRVEARPDGATAVVRVEDNGSGIAPELLPHVFDLFVQGPRAADRPEGGLGVGLALVRSLVRLHGGEVRAESAGAGRGSAFTVSLPTRDGPAPEVSPSAPDLAADGRRRVLVVDDNRDAAAMLGEVLAAYGYDVRVTFDPVAALAQAAAFAPELAIIDIGLPVMDGYELARELARRTEAPRMIALSGYGQPSDAERSRAAGFVEHLVKPVNTTRLLASLRAARQPR